MFAVRQLQFAAYSMVAAADRKPRKTS